MVDWLILAWLLFGGRRKRYILVETPEQREERRQREAEAWARLLAGGARFLSSGWGMMFIVAFLWATFPMVMDILTGGERCVDVPAALFIAKFLLRC